MSTGIRSSLYSFIILSVLFSSCCFYDSFYGDGTLPNFGILPPNFQVDPTVNSMKNCYNDKELCKHKISRSVKILECVCPEVANWYHDLEKRDKIRFRDVDDNKYCSYHYVYKELTIYPIFYTVNDGMRAAFLCHEYRHSRQNVGKVFRFLMSFSRHKEIVEIDAEIFEEIGREAIFMAYPKFR